MAAAVTPDFPLTEQPSPAACAEEDEAFFQSLLRGLAAREVQRFARGWLARRRFLRQRRAAARIQRAWRAAWPVLQARAAAARMIQQAWWGHRCRRTFRQLHRFVRAAEGGDPRLALAAIAQRQRGGPSPLPVGQQKRQVRHAQLQRLYQEGREQDAAASSGTGGGGGPALEELTANSGEALAGAPDGAVEEEEELLLWSRLLDYEE